MQTKLKAVQWDELPALRKEPHSVAQFGLRPVRSSPEFAIGAPPHGPLPRRTKPSVQRPRTSRTRQARPAGLLGQSLGMMSAAGRRVETREGAVLLARPGGLTLFEEDKKALALAK